MGGKLLFVGGGAVPLDTQKYLINSFIHIFANKKSNIDEEKYQEISRDLKL